MDLAVNDGKHGLDIQDPPGEGSCFGDTAAPFEIFQSIYQRHDNDFLLLCLQSLRNLLCGHSPVQKPERKLHQNACAHGCACTIHDIDIFVICRRDHGALICAGKLGGKGNDNGGLPGLLRLFKLLRKGARGRLTGGGQHIAFNQLLIEGLVVDGHAVNIFLPAEMNGEGDRIYPRLDLGDHIRGGINDDPGFQFCHAP